MKRKAVSDKQIRAEKLNERVKAAGLKNLNELVEISGVSRHTLSNWFHKKPALFNLVLIGAVIKKIEGIESDGKNT